MAQNRDLHAAAEGPAAVDKDHMNSIARREDEGVSQLGWVVLPGSLSPPAKEEMARPERFERPTLRFVV